MTVLLPPAGQSLLVVHTTTGARLSTLVDDDLSPDCLLVHPPLGKQLIAIGEALFGYDGFGWRFSAAACGVLTVFLTIRAARRLTRSTLLGGLAGILLICDGL